MDRMRRQPRGDSGIALVMAMGIALIGISLAVVVVTAVVVAANDSGRDRVRTVEVHSAEAAIDATMAELQAGVPCPAPSFDGLTYGSGAQATTVNVTIDYYDETGSAVGCASGVAASTPAKAIVTATATADKAQIGVQPVRTVQSEVLLTPITNPGANAAIFSAAGLDPKSTFEVEPAVSGESADIWVDAGDWDCTSNASSGSRTVGSVYIPAGSLTVGNGCKIIGDVWVQQNLTVTSNSPDDEIDGTGDVTVRSGVFSLGKSIEIPGAAKLGGAAPAGLTAVGGITENMGTAAIPSLTSVGLPQIEWNAATQSVWTSEGFDILGVSEMTSHMGQNACSSWNFNKPTDNPITIPAGTTGKNIYDLTSCGTIDAKKVSFKLYGDTALIMNDLNITTTFQVFSGDGAAHDFWIILPYSSGGGIDSNSTSFEVVSPVSTFIYAPGTIDLNPHGDFRGQIYGGVVAPKNKFTMDYNFVGIPGVDLAEGTSAIIGYDVELVYKREVS